MAKILSSKTHFFLIFIFFALSGFLFAFITETYWGKIQYENRPLSLPFSSAFFYSFCLIAYLMQGCAVYFIFQHSKKLLYDISLIFFWTQFFLGLLWLGLFFHLQYYGTAFFDLIATFLLLIFTFSSFRGVDLKAAYMLFPYGFLLLFMGLMNIWFFLV